jgi:uncharacterized membrane protein
MKKLVLLVLLIVSLFLPHHAVAQTEWIIESYDADIAINPDGIMTVTERLAVDFRDLKKHGIYRTIPKTYTSDTDTWYSTVDVGSVLQDGTKAETDVESGTHNVIIRIGDPDIEISGRHTYQLTYTVTGVLREFTNHDELYWNVTGNDWEAQILKASALITLPKDGITQTACFQGFIGATTPCQKSELGGNRVRFTTAASLNPGEGLTLVTGWKKGMVPILAVAKPKTFIEQLFEPLSILFFLTAVLLGTTASLLLWFKKGRDMWWGTLPAALTTDQIEKEKPLFANQAVVVEYTPPDSLRPAEIGVLADEQADTLDVTATIIDLATRGFLTITEIPKKWLFGDTDYELTKSKKTDEELLSYERLLLNRLFTTSDTVKISNLKRTFYDDLKQVKDRLYTDITKKQLFPNNPESVRNKYYFLAVAVALISGGLIWLGATTLSGPIGAFGIGGTFTVIPLFIMARNMPKRTAKGYAMLQRVKGYRLFIATAEKHRQKFFENKNMFNEVLPYAIVFGLTEKFAEAMKDIGLPMKQMSWYHGTGHFNAATFGNRVNAFSASMSSAIASQPKSSGFSGGSSGGGFGGGGGGSW